MGMAASQARYLALTARKTNTEYEGQQINQARTALANQSANLFNRLLDLEVPVAPKTTDYTELQYSFTDGQNESVIEEWTLLDSPNPDANYLVKHYYYTNKFTGAMKQLNDPQVQVSKGTISTTNSGIQQALDEYNNSKTALDSAVENRNNILNASQTMENYATNKNIFSARRITGGYEILDGAGNVVETFKNYTAVDQTQQAQADSILDELDKMGALKEDVKNNKQNDLFINSNGEIAFRSELESLYGVAVADGKNIFQTYNSADIANTINSYNMQNTLAGTVIQTAEMNFNSASTYYNDLKVPTHVGNCELVAFDPANEKQMTQIQQIVDDMKAQNIQDGVSKCFDEFGNYTGGIYSFQMGGQQYFTTYEELLASYDSHTGPNDIDGQIKLPYYSTSYIKSRVEQTSEALLETDSNGRFKTVKFTDNSLIYSLNTETVTDEAAYEDAMNEYRYKVQQYEKTIADINARTSIIQEEDRTLELRLKQLDTEQKALSTEMDAVKKVISDNIEKTFKTFSD